MNRYRLLFLNNELSEELAKTCELRSGILYRTIQRNGKPLAFLVYQSRLGGLLLIMYMKPFGILVGREPLKKCMSTIGLRKCQISSIIIWCQFSKLYV